MKDNKGEQFSEEVRLYDHYEYLDKVMSVTEGKNRITYGYHVDGQLATVTKGKVTEEFTWDGLALVRRGTTSYVNEPHPGGGAPVTSSDGGVMFNDILGTTLGVSSNDSYTLSSMTAFGDAANGQLPTSNFFTGKPHVDGLGHVFLLRNYRANLCKWPTADPLGYPDGWNQMAYCRNGVMNFIDRVGGACECESCGGNCHCTIEVYPTLFGDGQHYFMGRDGIPIFNPSNMIMNFMEDNFPNAHYFAAVHDALVGSLTSWGAPDWLVNIPTMPAAYVFAFAANNYQRFNDFLGYLLDLLKGPDIPPVIIEYCVCAE